MKRGGVVGPGLFFILPCLDTVSVVDLRTVSFDVPSQEILTSDSVTVSIDAVVYYNIEDPMAAVCNVERYAESTKLLAATTLRNMMGTKTLMQILEQKEEMARVMKDTLDSATDPWGIRVEMIEVKDVLLPRQMQRAMAAEAEADRDARAKVVAAEGEKKASMALKEASDIIDQSGYMSSTFNQASARSKYPTSAVLQKSSTHDHQVCPAAALPADVVLHRHREELNHRLPSAS